VGTLENQVKMKTNAITRTVFYHPLTCIYVLDVGLKRMCLVFCGKEDDSFLESPVRKEQGGLT
jgi:hypothetical protein